MYADMYYSHEVDSSQTCGQADIVSAAPYAIHSALGTPLLARAACGVCSHWRVVMCDFMHQASKTWTFCGRLNLLLSTWYFLPQVATVTRRFSNFNAVSPVYLCVHVYIYIYFSLRLRRQRVKPVLAVCKGASREPHTDHTCSSLTIFSSLRMCAWLSSALKAIMRRVSKASALSSACPA